MCDWIKLLAQPRLRKKTGKPNALSNAELTREILQLFLHRSFARDREGGRRISLLKRGEGAQAGLESLFFNQAAGLQKFPRPVVRPDPRSKRNFRQRNAGAMKTDFLFGTTKCVDRARQRLRADEDEPRRGQHFTGRGAVVRFVQVDQHVRAVK